MPSPRSPFRLDESLAVAFASAYLLGACTYDFDRLRGSPSSGVGGGRDAGTDASSGGSGGLRGDAGETGGTSSAAGGGDDASEEIAATGGSSGGTPDDGGKPEDADASEGGAEGSAPNDAAMDAPGDSAGDGGFDCASVKGTIYGGHCYWGVSAAVTWDDAENTSCAVADHGGHLVTITSAAEQAAVQTILPAQEKWIGLRKSAFSPPTELLFHWVTSEHYEPTTSYRHWESGDGGSEPNFTSDTGASGSTAGVDCVVMRSTGFWADDACPPTGGSPKKRGALCEHE